MKAIIISTALLAAIFSTSCSNGSEHQSSTVNSEKPTEVAATNPGKMKEFMALLDGNDGSSKKAAEIYFTDSLKNSLEEQNKLNFGDYNLVEAKVVSTDGDCCIMEAKSGVTTRSYKLCWQNDKINAIDDLGIK